MTVGKEGDDAAGGASLTSAPAVVLVEPQLGENIGAAARAMLNFGLTDLRLVAPRDGWPNPKAETMAAGALSVIEGAQVFDGVAGAVADCAYVAATTARRRDMLKPILGPEPAAMGLRERTARGEGCAILFGPERAGLSTDDVALADAIVSMPVNPAFSSLNLAQAVGVMAYAWAAANNDGAVDAQPLEGAAPATKDELFGLFAHLEEELDAAGYFFPAEKRGPMERNLRVMLTRAGLTAQEVQTLRGVVKTLAEGRRSARRHEG